MQLHGSLHRVLNLAEFACEYDSQKVPGRHRSFSRFVGVRKSPFDSTGEHARVAAVAVGRRGE
jgi:hypothetical protein